MIKTFYHKGLEDFYCDGTRKGIQPGHAEKIAGILDRLDAAPAVKDMSYPGSDLHPLKGQLKGKWAVKFSGNWRIVFKFKDGDAYDVDYVDYH